MNIYQQIASNKRKTLILIALFVVFVIIFGYIISLFFDFGLLGLGVFLIIFGVITYISYYNSDKVALALSHAKPATKENYPQLYSIVENLSIGLGQPVPKIYVIEDPAMNAFATGRDPKHSAVAATTGLLQALTKPELEGVMAHELSHVRNYDIRLMSLVVILAGSIAIISDFFLRSLIWGGGDRKNSNGILIVIALVAAVLAPIAAVLIKLSVSRNREYLADASGALLTRYPDGLASALEKISKHSNIKNASHATAHMFIESPFSGKETRNFFSNLYSTHPPAQERIKRLREM